MAPRLLLDINKAICLILQQSSCRYKSSGRRCQPQQPSITHVRLPPQSGRLQMKAEVQIKVEVCSLLSELIENRKSRVLFVICLFLVSSFLEAIKRCH